MKCRVVRNAKGNVIAAIPISQNRRVQVDIVLKRGQSSTVVDLPARVLRDPGLFRLRSRERTKSRSKTRTVA